MRSTKKILVCPLDWGLGHATRSVPVVRSLLARDCEVGVASAGPALELLRQEFPALTFYTLPAYQPSYSRNPSQILTLARQTPKFLRTIRQEHRELEAIIHRDGWKAVISDNRYGCWSTSVPSVFITHQLNIPVPRLLSGMVNWVNHRTIGKFDTCWIPDRKGDHSLTGYMSASNGFNVTHVGPLSRFQKSGAGMKYDILALISGPEFQRTNLENLLRPQLKATGKKVLLVRGLPGPPNEKSDGMVTEVDHLTSVELNRAIDSAAIVISRSGYSTIMDLAALGKKAIFIPTPGQPEQEYLAAALKRRKIAWSTGQSRFNLAEALVLADDYSGFEPGVPSSELDMEIDKLLASIR